MLHFSSHLLKMGKLMNDRIWKNGRIETSQPFSRHDLFIS